MYILSLFRCVGPPASATHFKNSNFSEFFFRRPRFQISVSLFRALGCPAGATHFQKSRVLERCFRWVVSPAGATYVQSPVEANLIIKCVACRHCCRRNQLIQNESLMKRYARQHTWIVKVVAPTAPKALLPVAKRDAFCPGTEK